MKLPILVRTPLNCNWICCVWLKMFVCLVWAEHRQSMTGKRRGKRFKGIVTDGKKQRQWKKVTERDGDRGETLRGHAATRSKLTDCDRERQWDGWHAEGVWCRWHEEDHHNDNDDDEEEEEEDYYYEENSHDATVIVQLVDPGDGRQACGQAGK